MSDTNINPRYIINKAGKKSGVVLSVKEYKSLLSAMEMVMDSSDFAKAKKTAKKFINATELRQKVFNKK